MTFYVEIAQGSPRNRGLLVPKDDLHKYINAKEPLYRSFYLYDETALDIASAKNSIKDYDGLRYVDNILLDIDKKDNSDELTLNLARGIIFQLQELGVPESGIQPYFSGTGYHIVITNEVFNFKASKDLPLHIKGTLMKILPECDASIYMRTGIYRVAHTKNQKTGLFKVPLFIREILNESVESIKDLAKEQRLEYPYEVLGGSGELEEVVDYTSSVARSADITFKKVNEPSKIVPCIQTLFREGPIQGRRHKTILRLASHFRRNGFPSEIAKAAILHWNNNQMSEDKVLGVVESTYNGGYRYSCKDELLALHCQTKCIYFKNKDYLIEVKDAKDMQEMLEERLETDFSGTCVNMGAALGLDESLDAIIYPGELVTVFGPTGSNKTTFVQNLALGLDFVNQTINKDWQVPTLFLSLELSAWYMHRRHLQIVAGKSKLDVNQGYKRIYLEHKDKLAHLVVQTVSPTIENIEQKIRELQPALVIVDYIDLVETPPSVRGEYEQVKYVSHNLSNMAVNNDCIIIQVSQVAREYSRNEVLDLYAGKGSGAIENASRKVIGLNGQAKDTKKTVQMYKNTDGELFKVDVEWQPSFRLKRRFENEID